MALYKIGVTEAGDAGVDLSWEEKLDDVDAAVLVTKCVSPDFFDAALRHKDKLIIHTTMTGYGHSILEPNVPTPYEEFAAIMELTKAGFPIRSSRSAKASPHAPSASPKAKDCSASATP